jgi:hypothetical protein
MCTAMRNNKILLYPGYEVIFEGTFNKLVEQIRRNDFVNICTRKIIGKRLWIFYYLKKE